MINLIYQDLSNSHLPQKPNSPIIDFSLGQNHKTLHLLDQNKIALPNCLNMRTNLPHMIYLSYPIRPNHPIPTVSQTCFTNPSNCLILTPNSESVTTSPHTSTNAPNIFHMTHETCKNTCHTSPITLTLIHPVAAPLMHTLAKNHEPKNVIFELP